MGHLKEGRELDVSVESRTLSVDAFDVPAVHARPDGMPRAGLVLHPDIGGLRPLFDDMARRLATYGIAVCAVEPFAGIPEAGARHRGPADRRTCGARRPPAARDARRSPPTCWSSTTTCRGFRVLGFCMGGHYAFKAAASDRFDAAVAFYGMLRTPDGWQGPGHTIEPLTVATEVCPTLAFFGTSDPWTPARRHRRVARRMARPPRLRDRADRRRRPWVRARSRT